MLYTVDETKNLYAYRNYVKNRADHVSIETVEIPKSLAN